MQKGKKMKVSKSPHFGYSMCLADAILAGDLDRVDLLLADTTVTFCRRISFINHFDYDPQVFMGR